MKTRKLASHRSATKLTQVLVSHNRGLKIAEKANKVRRETLKSTNKFKAQQT
jgi:hypothetical protein